MAINPADITTVRVDQLASEPITLTSLLPHQVGTDLKQDTVQALVDLVSTAIGVGSGVGYLPISVTDGQQLPDVPTDPSFFLCGAGTYLNINGFPNVICTGELNAVMSLPDHWELAVEIPIVAEVGVQTVTGSAVDNTDPFNPIIDLGGSQTLQQVIETGGIYTKAIGDITYDFDVYTADKFSSYIINSVSNQSGFIENNDSAVGLGQSDNDRTAQIIVQLDVVDGVEMNSLNQFGRNIIRAPFRTSGTSQDAIFVPPNNKPAGYYDLLASDGNDLLLQANVNWKIGDYLNDGLAFIEGSASLETIYYRTNNNIFQGAILPSVNNNYDIGKDSFRFKDAYFSGDIKVNGNSVLTRIVVSSNTNAVNDTNYTVVANATFTDPTPEEGKGYIVFVRNGMATIGGVGYTAGRNVYRFFHSGAWSTVVYVDKDYVDTALALKADKSTTPSIVVRNITPSAALTGTTVETQITSFNFTIPANTFSANDLLKIETIAWEKSGTANASTCRIKLSNTNNYAGASNVLILAASAANINMRGMRTYKIAGGNLKGFMSTSANGIFNDNTLTNVAVSTLALDVTQPIYGFVSLQNSSSADSTIVNELTITKW
jgi:hypothetical protein